LCYKILKLSALAAGAPLQTLSEEPRPYSTPQTPQLAKRRWERKRKEGNGKGDDKGTGEKGLYHF
jgi:hypothetical protein